jgi:hypothetical protein
MVDESYELVLHTLWMGVVLFVVAVVVEEKARNVD